MPLLATEKAQERTPAPARHFPLAWEQLCALAPRSGLLVREYADECYGVWRNEERIAFGPRDEVDRLLRALLGEPPQVRMPPLPAAPPPGRVGSRGREESEAVSLPPDNACKTHAKDILPCAWGTPLPIAAANDEAAITVPFSPAMNCAMTQYAIAHHAAASFIALILLADDTGTVTKRLDCDQCRAALDVLEAVRLIEVRGDEVRVLHAYDKTGVRALCEQVKCRLMDS